MSNKTRLKLTEEQEKFLSASADVYTGQQGYKVYKLGKTWYKCIPTTSDEWEVLSDQDILEYAVLNWDLINSNTGVTISFKP